jgi:tetratricopeptide (TPR) repeat protein
MWAGLILLLATTYRRLEWTGGSTIVACATMVAALSFPYAATLQSPSLSADAVWLQMQHDNLIWLGGDINLSSESSHAFWGNKVYSNDIPRQIKVAALPTRPTWEPGLHQASDLIVWLGFSEAFCQFSKSGWTLAVVGWALLAIATIHVRGVVRIPRMGAALAFLSAFLVILSAVAWGMAMSAAGIVEQAAILTRNRSYADALETLDKACDRLPVLGQDTYYIAQRGLLEYRLGRMTLYAKLFEAIEKERQGQYDVAYESFAELIDSDDSAIAREALRAVQRYAIQDFNSGRTELAISRLQGVLARQPCNLKVIYLMQICYLRQNRLPEVEAMSHWMDVATSHLSFHSKRIFRATTRRYAAIAASQANDADRAWSHSRKAMNP